MDVTRQGNASHGRALIHRIPREVCQMPAEEPWMRPYVLSITGLFLEEGFVHLTEALAQSAPDRAEAVLSAVQRMMEAQVAGIGERDDIPAAELVILRREVAARMEAVFARARQKLTASTGVAPSPEPQGRDAEAGSHLGWTLPAA
jgi:hypothetical protein